MTSGEFDVARQQNQVKDFMGRTISLKLTLQVKGGSESIVVNSAPMVDIVTSTSNTTLGEQTIANTPVLGRKFEDLLTLTPGVSISQGPDGDEINFRSARRQNLQQHQP